MAGRAERDIAFGDEEGATCPDGNWHCPAFWSTRRGGGGRRRFKGEGKGLPQDWPLSRENNHTKQTVKKKPVFPKREVSSVGKKTAAAIEGSRV